MQSGYSPRDIEGKWQQKWEQDGIYYAKDQPVSQKAEKFYGLVEFPYPSGEGLHVGHPRSYTAIDIMTRKRRMEGKNVLYPIGWDAFGLPTENFAIKHKIKPQDATKKNVANFTRQIKSLGIGFDWSREVNTTDPEYYKWTQWMFVQFYSSWYDAEADRARPISELPIPADIQTQGKQAIAAYVDEKRLAYKASATINWCPACKIGLANEEAQGGVCERCGGKVEKREKAQWMIRITSYADRLIRDLDTVDYLEKIRSQQINWIGRSKGASIDFTIDAKTADNKELEGVVTVFTTRPDTLFGVTYLVMAPDHPLIDGWLQDGAIKNTTDVQSYREATRKKSDLERQEAKDKTGAELKGVCAIHPVTEERLPIWISDYVLATYGTGAIMAVPAHDERDHAFAEVFGLPIKQVVFPGRAGEAESVRVCLKTLAEIAPLFREAKIDVFVEGGLALAFQNGLAYRAANDIDLVARDEQHLEQAAALLKVHGWEVTNLSEKMIAKKAGQAPVELIHPKGMAFGDRELSKQDLETEIRTLWGVQTRTISVEYQRAMKVWQAGHRDKTTDKVDMEWVGRSVFGGEGVAVNSDFIDRLSTSEAAKKMIDWLETNHKGRHTVTYKLRDWVFSRQRYWGEPIPIVFCDACGAVSVPLEQLPVTLPDVEAYQPTDTGESPLAVISDWVNVACPNCDQPAKRETDTMPNWAGSSWYFLRYCDPKNAEKFADPEKLRYWLPIDLYNGGMEHTTLHLLYSRFWYKVFWDLGHVPQECGSEPYAKRRSHAMILGAGGVKMSKSKGNVINPDDVVNQYGADVFRMYEMFIGPFDQDAPWDTNGIEGVKRFLEKVWRFYVGAHGNAPMVAAKNMSEALETLLHQTIKKVGDDIESMNFNTAVSAMMILANALIEQGVEETSVAAREAFLKILAPFAPHMTEELWEMMGGTQSIHVSGWPLYDPAKLQASTFELVIQVNGKVRDRMVVSTDITEDMVTQQALASEKVRVALVDKQPNKIVYVKGRLISIST